MKIKGLLFGGIEDAKINTERWVRAEEQKLWNARL